MGYRVLNIDESELLELREKGYTQKQLADHFNVGVNTIRRRLSKYGLRVDTSIDVSVAQVVDLYECGLTANEISKKLRISHDSVTKRLIKAGIVVDRATNIKKHFARAHQENWEVIRYDLDLGLSKTAVQRKHKLSPQTLANLMTVNVYQRRCVADLEGFKTVLADLDKIVNPKRRQATRLYFEAVLNYVDEYQTIPSGSSLAEFMGLSPQTVCWWFKQNGYTSWLNSGLTESFYAAEVRRWLEARGLPFEVNNRSLIYPYEVDFWIPSKNVGIEVNPSTTHHIGARGIDESYHYLKSDMALTRGFRLIHLYEWNYKNRVVDLCESMLESSPVPTDVSQLTLDLDKPRWLPSELHKHGFKQSSRIIPSAHETGQGSRKLTVYDSGAFTYVR